MRRGLVIALAALCASSCGRRLPTPFTADEMAKVGTGEALVHYLHQPGATAAVCAPRSAGPHLRDARREDFADLAEALRDGAVRPELWQRCAMLMLEGLPPDDAATLLDEMAHVYRRLLSASDVESDPAAKAKVEAVHRAFLHRPAGTAPREAAILADVTKLREALALGRLGASATRYGSEVLETIELDHGHWKGQRLTTAALDEMAAQKDEALLRRVAARVPDPAIVGEARRRIVRLHIAASASRHVKQHAAEIEATVLATGRNAVDVARAAPTTAWLDETRAKVRGVLVRQDVWNQTAKLLAFEGDRPGASLIPSINLRGSLLARVPGLDDPVTLCAPPEALDVTPCLLPADVRPKVPIVYIDAEGLLHFVERVVSGDAMRLAYNTANLPLPFEVRGRTLLTIEWPLVFERPDPVVFTGPTSGRGPDLRVKIEKRYSPRLFFEVTAPEGKFVGVVEPSDLESFAIASRGGSGPAGTRGTDGSTGSAGTTGSSASCPSSPGGQGGQGGRGGNGGPGSNGGPGGPGGDVVVRVTCATGACSAVATTARKVVRSEGGRGGSGGEGGRGGPGGAGGPGGSGTSCSDGKGHSSYVSSGSPGMKGADGSPGARGSDGPSGAPGRVDLRTSD